MNVRQSGVHDIHPRQNATSKASKDIRVKGFKIAFCTRKSQLWCPGITLIIHKRMLLSSKKKKAF